MANNRHPDQRSDAEKFAQWCVIIIIGLAIGWVIFKAGVEGTALHGAIRVLTGHER